MAPPADLRAWIALLEREGELVRVSAEVDPHLEVTEIVDRVVKAGGPALLFESPKSEHPLLINQFGTERRMCLAFGADSLDEVGRRLGDVLEMQPPQGIVEKVKGLGKLKRLADSMPKSVRSGPAQDVVVEPDRDDEHRDRAHRHDAHRHDAYRHGARRPGAHPGDVGPADGLHDGPAVAGADNRCSGVLTATVAVAGERARVAHTSGKNAATTSAAVVSDCSSAAP